jgi:hypothetical protein
MNTQTGVVGTVGVHLLAYAGVSFFIFWWGYEISSFLWIGLLILTGLFAYNDPLKLKTSQEKGTTVKNYLVLVASVYVPGLLGTGFAVLQKEYGIVMWIAIGLVAGVVKYAWPIVSPQLRGFIN